MDTKTYSVNINILLTPVGRPHCRVTLGDHVQDVHMKELTWINFQVSGLGPMQLNIEHYGKRDSDPTTAVVIEKITFNEITSPKFVWEGLYRPNYPSHMTGDSELKYHNYLGWNGMWTLDFTLPIYTWIHQVENLGWIYD